MKMRYPLIDNFTKNLQPCSGCGQIQQFVFESIKKGENVIFVLQVQVEAENAGDAIQKISSGKVISVNPRPQPQIAGSRIQGSPPNRTITPTETTTVTQPT